MTIKNALKVAVRSQDLLGRQPSNWRFRDWVSFAVDVSEAGSEVIYSWAAQLHVVPTLHEAEQLWKRYIVSRGQFSISPLGTKCRPRVKLAVFLNSRECSRFWTLSEQGALVRWIKIRNRTKAPRKTTRVMHIDDMCWCHEVEVTQLSDVLISHVNLDMKKRCFYSKF
jgi:hypothetical protein